MINAVETQREKILIVHDDTDILDIIQVLFGHSHTLLTAVSREQSLATAIEEDPDLIIVNPKMTDMDGFEICSQLKSRPETENIPVIFVTENSRAEDELAGLVSGAIDYFTKPLNPEIVAARIRNHLSLKRRLDVLELMSAVDALTGVPNRRRFDEYMDQEWRRGNRNQYPLSLLMIDIDHFKRVNDEFGHQVGDRVLSEIADRIGRIIRGEDVAFRFGGEEFLALLALLLQRLRLDRLGADEVDHHVRRDLRPLSEPTDLGALGEVLERRVGGTWWGGGLELHDRPD